MKITWNQLLIGMMLTASLSLQGAETLPEKPLIISYTGEEARECFDDIAQLCITMFAGFPYLYNGSLKYEKNCWETYFKSPDTEILLGYDEDGLACLSNSIPLAQGSEEIQKPFKQRNLDLAKYLYIGQVLIKQKYRGQGIARDFFDIHEERARAHGHDYTIFATVEREENDPLKPEGYVSPDAIWQHFGYTKDKNLSVTLDWPSVDPNRDSKNTLSIWWKRVK